MTTTVHILLLTASIVLACLVGRIAIMTIGLRGPGPDEAPDANEPPKAAP